MPLAVADFLPPLNRFGVPKDGPEFVVLWLGIGGFNP